MNTNHIYHAKILAHICSTNHVELPQTLIYLTINNFQGFYYIDTDSYTNEQTLNIFFDGSNEFIDWWDNNLSFRKEKLYINDVYCGKIHSGFLKYYKNIQKTFTSLIMQHLDCTQINLYGFSLGSSCIIGALEISFIDKCPPVFVTTFGSPPIGDKVFATVYNNRVKNSIRYVNKTDPIPKIPSSLCHVNKQIILGNTKKSIIQTIKQFFNVKNIVKSHYMDTYCYNLEHFNDVM